jgi:hypothetical protein
VLRAFNRQEHSLRRITKMSNDEPKLKIVKPYVEFITPKYDPNWNISALKLIEECARYPIKVRGELPRAVQNPLSRRWLLIGSMKVF